MSAATSEPIAASTNQWRANTAAARLARAGMFGIPLAVGLIVMWLVPAATLFALASGLVGAIVADRFSRRLGPLSTLYELSLTFPVVAPSRLKIANRISSTNVEQELEAISTGDDFEAEDPQDSAERSLVLVGLLDRHDRLTGGHSVRVHRYVEMTAHAMGVAEDERAKLAWGSLLHDIGKLKVSGEILTATDGLTDARRVELEAHPGHSADLMRSLFEWLGDAFGAATEHHEHWDGNGYPIQLAGDEISLSGRITAVADAFDVMTASKSYRPTVSSSEARSELLSCSGAQFDPAVVRAFVNLSLDRNWVRPFSWILETPGLARNALGMAPIAVAAILLGSLATAGSLGAGPDSDSGGTARPGELAAVDDDSETPVSTTTTTEAVTSSSVAPNLTTQPTTEASSTTTDPAGQVDDPEATNSPATTAQVKYPSASDDKFSTGPGEWIVMEVLKNDDSGDFPWNRATLDFYIEPEHGDKWEALSDGRLRYRPLPNYAGPDTFSYVVCNEGGHCAIGTVTVAVEEN